LIPDATNCADFEGSMNLGMSTNSIATTHRISKRSAGFMLWEVMLAVTIFCVVAISLAAALQQTVDAAILLRDESQVRIELQNLLNRTVAEKLKIGKSEVKEGDGRVHYEREIRAVLAKTAKGVPVPDLYEIIVRASWRSGSQDRSDQAQLIVYRP
jgi:type II secretory pathway component PulJ